jgi:hypothetical protein
MPRGGKRPGAGRPKGSIEPKRIEKEEARARLRALVMASMDPLVQAQIDNAKGIKYLVAREKKSGKFRRLTEAQALLQVGGEEANDLEIIEVWEKDPSVQAFTDLMNRTIDKPVEQVTAEVTGGLVIRWQGEE